MRKLYIYKNRIISVLIVILFLATIMIVAIKNDINKPKKETLEKIGDKIVATQATEKTSEEIEKELQSSNLKIINNKLNIINKKHEILLTYIPSDYTELDSLNMEIKNLNNSIKEKQLQIAAEDDIFKEILSNLDTVNISLNELLLIFGTSLESPNIIDGNIILIDGSQLIVNVSDKQYNVVYNSNTIIDGNLSENCNVIIICKESISDEINTADLMIIK